MSDETAFEKLQTRSGVYRDINIPTKQEKFFSGLGLRPISMWPRSWRANRSKFAGVLSGKGAEL